eukprot:1849241-Pyramimonas_sp.AAC.2
MAGASGGNPGGFTPVTPFAQQLQSQRQMGGPGPFTATASICKRMFDSDCFAGKGKFDSDGFVGKGKFDSDGFVASKGKFDSDGFTGKGKIDSDGFAGFTGKGKIDSDGFAGKGKINIDSDGLFGKGRIDSDDVTNNCGYGRIRISDNCGNGGYGDGIGGKGIAGQSYGQPVQCSIGQPSFVQVNFQQKGQVVGMAAAPVAGMPVCEVVGMSAAPVPGVQVPVAKQMSVSVPMTPCRSSPLTPPLNPVRCPQPPAMRPPPHLLSNPVCVSKASVTMGPPPKMAILPPLPEGWRPY